MADLFLDVLNTSFAATWVVLAVILARLLLKKAPRWMVCSLWVLVAARMLIGSGIVAPFSMIPSAEVIPPQSLYDQAPVIHSGVAILDNAINPVYTESLRPMPGASVNPLQVWTAVYALIWLVGMAVLALWAVFSWDRVRRQVRESIPTEDGVFLCDRIASPFIFGLFRPKIYLPSDLNTDARSHVIAHEKAHLHRRDHWWKPLGFVLLTINWFNPAMWLAYILLCRDIEMACDEKVIRDHTVEDKKAYSAALLCCSVNSRRITACPLAFGEVGVKQRVKSVLNYKKPAFWVILAAVALITVLAVGLLTSPVEHISEIRYNGNLYELFNQNYSFLPTEDSVGCLADILHNTSKHPNEDFQGTNLNEDLIGSPLYLEENRLYLQKHDGSCIAFRLSEPDIQNATPPPTETQETNLGISLHLENLTADGATLVCTQDGTLWHEIITGSDWTIQEYREGIWADLMPEEIAWTAEAYPILIGGSRSFSISWSRMIGSLTSGRYRIGKHFTAYAKTTLHQSAKESVSQTIYAEFTIDFLQAGVFSPELQQALWDDWKAYDAMSEFDRLASSKTPGYCTREFDEWAEMERFVGMEIPNPLEELETLEKGNWAAMPVGYNGGSRFYVTWQGARDGQLQQVAVDSGYRRGNVRVGLKASLFPDSSAEQQHQAYQIISSQGDAYEVRTVSLNRGSIEYTIRVLGDPETGDELTLLLEELLPYFEEIA